MKRAKSKKTTNAEIEAAKTNKIKPAHSSLHFHIWQPASRISPFFLCSNVKPALMKPYSCSFFFQNSEISLFETNIRFMGSLLACYALTGDVMFRDKAAQLGERMLPAFQTETGIPHSLINLHTGVSSGISRSRRRPRC